MTSDTPSWASLPSWLSASAAVIQAGVAFALYKITKQYVVLTGRLANASEAQVEMMRAERSSDQADTRRQLVGLAGALLSRLRQLPGPTAEAIQQADSRFRTATLPTEAELIELRQLAVKIGPAVSSLAATAIDSLSWLFRWVEQAQKTSPAQGYDYSQVNWRQWAVRWTQAEQALLRLSVG